MKNQLIKDSEYTQWIARVVDDFKRCQIQAALRVNGELLQFYWNMGRDIESRQMDNRYGTQFYANASRDIRSRLNQVRGLSETNIRYAKRFYCIYSQLFGNIQQPAEELGNSPKGQNLQQPAEEFRILFSIPWTHHLYIIDKTKGNAEKAWFYVQQTLANNWSRSVLLNFLSTDLYERQGKSITNFQRTLPSIQGDLAQQMSKDPYCFDVLSQTTEYTEKELKDALEDNVQKMLLELGKGFAYMGREVRIDIGGVEKFMDMLFYCVPLHSYVVVEIKTDKFDSENLGQLGTYVVAVNHQLNTEGDNPAIGLLICKEKNNILAKYALESMSQPLGISEYALTKVYPEKFTSSLPSIEDIENSLNDSTK